MPTSPPVLTIAVPTYNRSANLELLLRGLAPDLANEHRVELLISDNCSPDDTPALVERFVQNGLRCRYIRNEKNIGPDLNFLQCYSLAAGEYVWVFGDDDVLLPGSVATILRWIDNRSFDLVYLAPFGFLKEPNERGLANDSPRCREFCDVSAFIHAIGLSGDLALITSTLVNKRRIESYPHPPFTDALNTNLLQLGWVFTALKHFQRGLVVERGLYAVCETNPSRPFDIARVFGVNWHKLAKRFLDEGSAAQEAVLNDQLYSWFPTNWYAQRKSAARTQSAPPHTLLGPLYGDRLLYWLSVYPLLTWPTLLAGGWLAILRGIRKIDRLLHRAFYWKRHRKEAMPLCFPSK
jgi:abequosyltransferase